MELKSSPNGAQSSSEPDERATDELPCPTWQRPRPGDPPSLGTEGACRPLTLPLTQRGTVSSRIWSQDEAGPVLFVHVSVDPGPGSARGSLPNSHPSCPSPQLWPVSSLLQLWPVSSLLCSCLGGTCGTGYLGTAGGSPPRGVLGGLVRVPAGLWGEPWGSGGDLDAEGVLGVRVSTRAFAGAGRGARAARGEPRV